MLRAARALIDAHVPRRRISRSLQDLRRHLPETLPLSGLSISALGDRVVVRDGTNQYQADNGQYVLGFEVHVENGVLHVVERVEEPAHDPDAGAVDDANWFDRAIALEGGDPGAAREAYEHAVRVDPSNCAAWINWGRLLHEQGDLREAERIYRNAATQCGPEPVLMFNLGVLLEDMGRSDAAVEAYQSAITEDPALADGHYNLARLYESLGKPQHAIRHLGQYRRLVSSDPR